MEIKRKIESLEEGDTKSAYENLKELEAISEQKNVLYPYMDKFISMLNSEKYVIRVRGFRLLCKQAKWDTDSKINDNINDILTAVNDEKPTAVRQALKYLKFVVPYKKELNSIIKQAVLKIDCSGYKDTMQPLIKKDIQNLARQIDIITKDEQEDAMEKEKLLRDPEIFPSDEVLADALKKGSFAAYQTFAKKLPELSIAPEWRYYNDGKSWLTKGVHKKKTVFWLSVWDGFFRVTIFFTEKTRDGIQELSISPDIKSKIANEPVNGKLIPLMTDIDANTKLEDVYELIRYKQSLK